MLVEYRAPKAAGFSTRVALPELRFGSPPSVSLRSSGLEEDFYKIQAMESGLKCLKKAFVLLIYDHTFYAPVPP